MLGSSHVRAPPQIEGSLNPRLPILHRALAPLFPSPPPVRPTRSLTSYTSRATPGKSRSRLRSICSLMPVPGSGGRLPLFLGASMTNQNALNDDDNIHENAEAEGDRTGARSQVSTCAS